MSDILAIKRALEGRAKEVAERLLPNGKLEGRDWCVGSVAGEAGHSLKVCVMGAKAGVWADFAAGGDEGGDLIDLWMAVKGMQLPQALDDIRGFLGIEAPKFESDSRRTYTRPEKPKCGVPKSLVRDYLVNERKITDNAIRAYRVGEDGKNIVFPGFVDGTLYIAKFIPIDRKKGGRAPWATADSEPVLLGWHMVDPNAREILICEGEIDCLTWYDYGAPCAVVTVPFGAGKGNKQQWIASDFDRLSRFETIYLAMDHDKEGDLAVEEIVARLGRHRCRRVMLPHKDANECRLNGVPPSVMVKCIEDAKTMDPPELVRAGRFADDVVKLFWPDDGVEPGYWLPWRHISDRVLFRPAELTIWTGPSGHGKTQVLSHASVAWGVQGARVCIASLEMQPKQFLRRMVKQAGNVDRPSEPEIRHIIGWMDEWLWCFNLVGKASPEKLIEVFEYARTRYGCDVFVIDSMMRMGIGSEDYQGQEKAVYGLVTWAVEKSVHVHLVAHSRKADTKNGGGAPETEDIKGASEIGSNAFNIIGIWRDRKTEDRIKVLQDKLAAGDRSAEHEIHEMRQTPGVIMNVAKQRNGDWEGKCGLWFSQETYQYRSRDDAEAGMRHAPERGPNLRVA